MAAGSASESWLVLVAMPSFKLELWQATRNDGERWQLPTTLTCFLYAAAFLGAPFFDDAVSLLGAH